jgi:flagellum-specific peptidoglycan hydrolase FlgJ
MSNTRTIVIVAIVAGTLLYLSQQAGGIAAITSDLSAIFDNLDQWFAQTTIARIYQAYQSLQNAGLSGVQLKLALCQVMYETGAFSSESVAANTDNNLSGIVWINNPSIQVNATQGGPADTPGYYWADYATINDWAIDYVRIVNDGPYYPLTNATDTSSFAALLQENGYYTGSETDYAAGMLHYWNIFTDIGL